MNGTARRLPSGSRESLRSRCISHWFIELSSVATKPRRKLSGLKWHADGPGLRVPAPILSAVAPRGTPARTQLNLRAVADYLTIGAVLEDKTLVEGVQSLLDAGTVLEFDLDGGPGPSPHRPVDTASFFATKAARVRLQLPRRCRRSVFRGSGRSLCIGRALCPLGLSLSGGILHAGRFSVSVLWLGGRALSTHTLGRRWLRRPDHSRSSPRG